MKRTVTINYWWKCDKFKEIPHELKEQLEEDAMDRITTMMGKGTLSGELNTYITEDVPGKKMPKDGWHCTGWWDTSESIHGELIDALKRARATAPNGTAYALFDELIKRAKGE